MSDTVAVLGPGAVGGALAAHLAHAGCTRSASRAVTWPGVMALSGLTLEVDGREPLVVRPR